MIGVLYASSNDQIKYFRGRLPLICYSPGKVRAFASLHNRGPMVGSSSITKVLQDSVDKSYRPSQKGSVQVTEQRVLS